MSDPGRRGALRLLGWLTAANALALAVAAALGGGPPTEAARRLALLCGLG